MKTQLIALIVAWIAFVTYTLVVVAEHGYTGFLTLAFSEAWAGQMLVDLVIGMSLFLVWMLRDAREKAIAAWPYVVLIVTTGSIGALSYLIHRTAKTIRSDAPGAAVVET